ncbi:MAG TPA: MarR family transcriptional regulator [Ramlibacter sp.]|jgi:DNA-binding MarR family transcriptional regulator
MRANPDAPRLARPQTLDDVLLYRMSRLLSTAGSMVIRLCEGGFGITRREWRLIALLAHEEGLLSSQLADHAQLDRARTSRAVTSLVAKKLVRRTQGTADRREARIALTAGGRDLYEQLFPLVLQINRELLAPIPRTQLEAVDRALDRMQRQADDMVRNAHLPKADRRRGGRVRAGMG